MMKPDKTFDTGIRLLEILKIFLEKEVSKKDIIEMLKTGISVDGVYTNEVFIKYFNTLEMLGFKLARNKGVYSLRNSVTQISLSKDEVKVFTDLIRYISKIHNKTIETSLRRILYMSVKFINNESQERIFAALDEKQTEINNGNNMVNLLESFLNDKQMVSLTYIRNNVEKTMITEIKEIIEKKGDFIVVCYDPVNARNKKIYAKSIISVTQLPRRTSGVNRLNTVIFKLYGRLASSYKLKASEKSIDFVPGCLTVSNSEEDRDTLLKRLLKYGENCQIIQPLDVKKNFISLTDDILRNLQEEVV